jgi:hypothetical protein
MSALICDAEIYKKIKTSVNRINPKINGKSNKYNIPASNKLKKAIKLRFISFIG